MEGEAVDNRFYFERFLLHFMENISAYEIVEGLTPSLLGIATACALAVFFQSLLRGRDVRQLGSVLVTFGITVALLVNYDATFKAANGTFLELARVVKNAGPKDKEDSMAAWKDTLEKKWEEHSGWDLLWAPFSAVVNLLNAMIAIVSYILYPVVYLLFLWAYGLFGVLLYMVGPVVLCLLPLGSVGIARSFLLGFFNFGMWAVLYACFNVMIRVINDKYNMMRGDPDSTADEGFLIMSAAELGGDLLIAISSLVFSFCIILIPFISHFLVRGNMSGVAGTLAFAATQLGGVGAAKGLLGKVGSKLGSWGGGGTSSGSSSSSTPGGLGGGGTPGMGGGAPALPPAAPQRALGVGGAPPRLLVGASGGPKGLLPPAPPRALLGPGR